jgi:hypothetical protein
MAVDLYVLWVDDLQPANAIMRRFRRIVPPIII